jgi:ABC-2 type transport system ATP-binding protein
MIAVKDLVKWYGAFVAVRGVSFEVAEGNVVGFLGPNGAGKSTTLRILAGFLGKTSGEVRIAGLDLDDEPERVKACIGYMPEAVPLYTEMRVREYLTFRAELKRVPSRQRASAVADAMNKARIVDVANRTMGQLSKGYRQRVGLADALVANPPLLILDEPTSGLDPNQIREVREVIRGLSAGKKHTVLLSTHILSEVEASCDHVIVIDKGKLVATGSKEEVAQLRHRRKTEFEIRGPAEQAAAILRSVQEAETVDLRPGAPGTDDICILHCSWKQSVAADVAEATERAVAALVAAGLGIRRVAAPKSSLEDVFAELTGEGAETSPTRAAS